MTGFAITVLSGKFTVSFKIKSKILASLDDLQANAMAQRGWLMTGIDTTQPIDIRISPSPLENEQHAYRVCDTLVISDCTIPALTPFALPCAPAEVPFFADAEVSVQLPLYKRGIEGDLFYKISPNPSATAPCVALPPASMQSSFAKREIERLNAEACTAPEQFSVTSGWLANQWRQVRFSCGQHYHLSIDELGDYRVTGSDIAFIQNESITANEEVVLGPCLILALAMRTIFTLHASAWGSADGIIGFIGESGAGKSTLAAFLDQHFSGVPSRFSRFADDCLPVTVQNGDAVAMPHFPQLKLPASAHYAAGNPPRVPVRALVSLAGNRSQNTIEITPLHGKDALLEIVRHTIAAKLFGADLNQQHLAFAAQFIGNVPVYRMRYPHRREQLPAVADRLLDLVVR